MSALGSLVVSLTAETASFHGALEKAAYSADKRMGDIARSVGAAGSELGALATRLGAISGVIGGLSFAGLAMMVKETITATAALDDMAEKTGSTVEQLSALQEVAKVGGHDMEGIGQAIIKLTKSMSDADDAGTKQAAAFKAIGVSVKDSSGNLKDAGVLYEEIARKLDGFKDGAGKTAAAMVLMGKSGADQLPMMKDLVEYGTLVAKVTAQQASEAEALEKNLNRLGLVKQDLVRTVSTQLVPALNDVVTVMLNAATETGGLRDQVNGLAQENAIQTWAQDAALVIGVVVDGLKLAGNLARVLGQSFAVVMADVEVFRALPMKFGLGATDETKAQFAKVLADRNQTLADANKSYADLWNARGDATEQALKRQFAATNAMRDLAANSDAIDRRLAATAAAATKTKSGLGVVDELKEVKQAVFDYAKAVDALYKTLDNTALSVNQEFYDQLTMLHIEFTHGEMSLEKYQKRVETLILNTKFGAEATKKLGEEAKAAAKEWTEFAEALQKADDAQRKATDSAKQIIANLEFETQALSMTNTERETAIRLRELENAGILKGTAQWDEYAAAIRAAVESKEGVQAQITLWKQIEDVATNAIESILTKGSNGFRELWNNFKNWAFKAFAQIAAKQLTVSLAGSFGAGGAAAGGVGGGTGGVGLGDLGGLAGSIGSYLGIGAGSAFSAAAGAGFSAGIATLEIAASAGVAAIGGIGSALGAMAAVAGPVALALGAIYLAYQTFGQQKGGPKGGGFASTGNTSGISGTDNSGRWFTPSTEDAAVKTVVEATAASYTSLLKSLGGTGSAGFALGFDTDPKGTAPNRVHAGAFVNGTQVYNAALGDLGRDTEKIKAVMELESKRALLAALQASTLPDDMARILNSVNAGTATGDMIERTLEFAAAIRSLGDVLERDPLADAMTAIANATDGSFAAFTRSGAAMTKLVAEYDGSVGATNKLAAATQAYYAQQVQLLVQIEQIKTAIGSMFSDTVRGLTLTTLDPRDKANFLLNESNALTAQLEKEKDPARIQALANRINQNITEAFGLLDPEAQKQRLAEFTAYATNVSTFVSDRLTEIGADVRNSASDILTLVKDAFQVAVDNFVAAATTNNTAANTQLAAANTPIRVEVSIEGGGTVNG